MSNPLKWVPEGSRSLTPHLVTAGASDAIDFYVEAFGAVEKLRMPSPDGKLMHASLAIGDSEFYLCDEFDGHTTSPATLGGTPVTIHLYVEDVDASFARAVAAGATALMPPADMFWGSRYGQVVDPFGHRWSLATPITDPAAVLSECVPEPQLA